MSVKLTVNFVVFDIDKARRPTTGMAAIHIAARQGKHRLLKELLIFGSQANLKCWSGMYLVMISFFFLRCFQPDYRLHRQVNFTKPSGLYYMSPLHLAVYFAEDNLIDEDDWFRYRDTIDLLLETQFSHCPVDEIDGMERTALHWAAYRGWT